MSDEIENKKKPGPKPQFDVSFTGWMNRRQSAVLNRVMKLNRLPSRSAALRFILDELAGVGR